MKKLLIILLTTTIYADDLDLGDDFVAGTVVKAADFNTKFSLIEGQEAELTNSYFVGTWSCKGPSNNGFHDNVTFVSDGFFGDVDSEGYSIYAKGNVTFSLDNDGYLAMSNNNILFINDRSTGTLHYDSGYIWDKFNGQYADSEVRKVSQSRFYFVANTGPRFTCTKT